MLTRIFKYGVVTVLAIAMAVGITYRVMAAPGDDHYLFRVQVHAEHGEEVAISFPPVMLETIYSVMPLKVQRLCEEMELTPDVILRELETLQGEDLVRIEGRDRVRIWLEPVTDETRSSLGFVKVHVVEGGENGHEVNVCIPRGLAQLAGRVIARTGLVEELVVLSPEVETLMEANSAE